MLTSWWRLPGGGVSKAAGQDASKRLGGDGYMRREHCGLRWEAQPWPEGRREGSRRYLEAARDAGLRRVVVSSSANTAEVLEVTGLVTLVEGWIDGLSIADQGLKGKPAPDTFLAGARCVGVDPPQAAVFEDALAGVAAGRTGGFGFVVGVNWIGQADALRAHGADIVVSDLADLLDAPDAEVAR
jgi:beta-phosphoglucomutase-like phosphatase (HAD superfamily)